MWTTPVPYWEPSVAKSVATRASVEVGVIPISWSPALPANPSDVPRKKNTSPASLAPPAPLLPAILQASLCFDGANLAILLSQK